MVLVRVTSEKISCEQYKQIEWQKTELVPILLLPVLLGTSPMSKQETKKSIYNWTSEIIPFIRLGKQMDRT